MDQLIRTKQFSAWVDAHERSKTERAAWEMWLYKLGAWDERSFNEFKDEAMKKAVQIEDIPSDEQIIATIKISREILSCFNIQKGG